MDIRTNYLITITVDDLPYKLTVRDANKKDEAEIDQWREKSTKNFAKRDEILSELTEKRDTYKFNNIILTDEKYEGSVSALCIEQKKLNEDIHKLNRDLIQEEKKIEPLNDILESLMKKRFDLLVSGDEKDAFKNIIEENGISYTFIAEVMGKKIQEEKEKK